MLKPFPRAPLAKRIGKVMHDWLVAENEKPLIAVREWLKIIIAAVAIGALVQQTRQLRTQVGTLKTQGDQLTVQSEQLKIQAEQSKDSGPAI